MPAALVTALVVVVTALATGCSLVGGEASPEDVSFDLRVGVVTSFSGDLSASGQPVDRAVRLGVELIQESLERVGAEGISVEVVSEDDQTHPTAGVEAATKLVHTDEVDVIVGAVASSVTTRIAESVTVPNQVVQISPGSTSPSLTNLADGGFVWRTAPSDALQGRALAGAMADEFGADATVNVGAREDAYGTEIAGVFAEAWREGGGTVGRSVRWHAEAKSVDREAMELAGGTPDAWLIVDLPETWGRVGPALVRAGGWDPARTFTAAGLRRRRLPEETGAATTEGMHGIAPTSDTHAAEAFARIWEEHSGGLDRHPSDVRAFDAVVLAFLSALRGGSADPAVIRDNLREVSRPGGTRYTFAQLDHAIRALLNGEEIDYEGASGPIDFDENGDPGAAVYEVWRFRGGEIQTLGSLTIEP